MSKTQAAGKDGQKRIYSQVGKESYQSKTLKHGENTGQADKHGY